MTAEEVDKYINEIAYSGLVDFVEKYQKEGDPQSQIIGHFGLGFYSAFMVADKVEIRLRVASRINRLFIGKVKRESNSKCPKVSVTNPEPILLCI